MLDCVIKDGTIVDSSGAPARTLRLELHKAQVHHDLPAGGARFVSGVQTRADDEDIGARPGRLAKRQLVTS